ncbi:glutathione binding-like protein [Fructilactobacillus sp. Tb1]|uniref:glutathione binding-like protein n=1 Tax=Fructilactobacillus sp. Tb1 TaxID=3422304 RepID=UPI003D2CEEDB
MMKLFYASGASSLAPHILLEEIGLPYQTEKVNLDNKTWNNSDYNLINEKSYVPALETHTKKVITECAVILEYLSVNSNSNFIANYDTDTYWEERTWLNYIATELHKNFISPFRNGNWLANTDDSKKLVYKRVFPRLKFIDKHLKNQNYMINNKFSLVDPYLFVMTNWIKRLDFTFDNLPNLKRFDETMRNRPAVQRVLKAEGAPHSLSE